MAALAELAELVEKARAGAPAPKVGSGIKAITRAGGIPRKPAKATANKPGYHDAARAHLQAKRTAQRTEAQKGQHAHLPVKHGGFTCQHCGGADWREHPVYNHRGQLHPHMAFKGCVSCGAMHQSRVGISKTEGETVDVAKDVDTSETALQSQSGETVGHRRNCPRGGSSPCGAARGGRCTTCSAQVADHDAIGKTTESTLLELRVLASRLKAEPAGSERRT